MIRAIERAACPDLQGKYLDIGSGKGELVEAIKARFPNLTTFACDYTDQLMTRAGQAVAIVDLNHQPLPYPPNEFALVTCSETIEHLENYWSLLRETHRVLQPGGIAIFSTPNILNLRSRFRFLTSGFYNLFGPVMPDEKDIFSPRGHITPVSWFYLANALLSTGFVDVAAAVDKYQRRSFVSYALLSAPIRLSSRLTLRREKNRFQTINERNVATVRAINSTDLLLGRTLIVRARKPS